MNGKRIITASFILMFYVLSGLGLRPAVAQDFSKDIDVLGFKFVVDDGGDVAVENDKLVLKGSGSMDLSSALGDGVVLKVDDMVIDHDTTFTMKGINQPEFKLGDLTAKIAPGDIVIEKIAEPGRDAYLNLNAVLKLNLAGNEVEVASSIPIDINGIKDTTIKIAPPSGSDAFLTKTYDGLNLSVDSGRVVVSGGSVQDTSFSGALEVFGAKFELGKVDVAADAVSGSVKAPQGTKLTMGSISLAVAGNVAYDVSSAGVKLTMDRLSLDMGTVIDGASGEISVSPMEIVDGKFDVSGQTLQKIDIYGVGIVVSKYSMSAENRPTGAYLKVAMDGEVQIDDIGLNVAFTGLEVDSDGKVKGDIDLPESQEFEMFGVSFTIDELEFVTGSDSFSIAASGNFNLGDDKVPFSSLTIAQGGVNAEFEVSSDKPFSFSWFKDLKLNSMKVEKSKLAMGGSIDIPKPFNYKFGFDDIKFDSDGAVAEETRKAQESSDKTARVKAGDPNLIVLANKDDKAVEVGGFSFNIDAVTIPNPLKVAKTGIAPDTLVNMYMRSQFAMGDKQIDFNLDGIEVTKDGVSDKTITIPPPDGQKNLFSAVFPGWAEISIASAKLVIADESIDEFSFNGAAKINGAEFTILKFGFEDGNMAGELRPEGDPKLDLAGVKLAYKNDVVFKITGGGKGGGDPGSLETVFEGVSIDFSSLVGTSMQIMMDELKVVNGNIDTLADISTTLEIYGIKLKLSSVSLISKAPSDGDRVFTAALAGVFSIAEPSISLSFTGFKISSDGSFGGELALASAQEFELFGALFTIDGIKMAKKDNSVETSLAGSISALGTNLDFSALVIKEGKISATFDLGEDDAISVSYCKFIKISYLSFTSAGIQMNGFLELPSPIGAKLPLNNIKMDANGTLKGGDLVLGDEIVSPVGVFKLAVTEATFDMNSRYVVFSGELRMPSSAFAKPFKFSKMGMSLAGNGNLDTASTKFETTEVHDDMHDLPIKISEMSMGVRSNKFFILMQGELEVMSGGDDDEDSGSGGGSGGSGGGKKSSGPSGFKLYFNDFSIDQDLDFNIGSITGGIMIAGFGVEVKKLELGDDYTLFSGGMSLPSIGGIFVEGLKIYKSGKIELEGIEVSVDYKAYEITVGISYKDEILKAKGIVKLAGKGLAVKGEFGPTYFSLDLDVYGLQIPLFPGIFLDSIGGGITCKIDPFFMEFRIRAGIAFGDANLLYGKVQLSVNTDGIIKIEGELTAFTMFPIAQVVIVLDVPHATLTGVAKINAPVASIVLWVDAEIKIFASPDDFYLEATADAKILNIWTVGNAYFYVGTKGFKFKCSMSIDLGFVGAGFEFEFEINRSLVISAYFHGWLKFDIWIASVSGDIKAWIKIDPGNFDNSYFKGTVNLKACVLGICGSVDVYLKIDKDGVHAGKQEYE